MLVDPIPKSLVARLPTEESTIAAGGLDGGVRLASMVDGSVMVSEVTMKTAGSSGAEAGATDVTLAFGAEGPVVPVEQTVPPKASEGVVGHARWCLQLQRRRTRWKRSSMLNLNPNLSKSSASTMTRWWLSRRRTPVGR